MIPFVYKKAHNLIYCCSILDGLMTVPHTTSKFSRIAVIREKDLPFEWKETGNDMDLLLSSTFGNVIDF